MMTNKPFTRISSVVFAVVAALHLWRLLAQFPITISGREMPLWANVIGLIVASVLSLGLWREAK